ERHAVDVRRREPTAFLRFRDGLADRLAEEKQRSAGAIAYCRLGDDDRHRQEAFALEQPLRTVELAVLGIPEQAFFLPKNLERKSCSDGRSNSESGPGH